MMMMKLILVLVCSLALGIYIGSYITLMKLEPILASYDSSNNNKMNEGYDETHCLLSSSLKKFKKATSSSSSSDKDLISTLQIAALRSHAHKPSVFRKYSPSYCTRVSHYRKSNVNSNHFAKILHTDIPDGYMPKEVLKSIGWLDPVKTHAPDSGWKYALPSAQLFWFQRTYLYSRYDTHFPCKGQAAKFLPGSEYAGSKATLVGRLREYGTFFSSAQSCFNFTDMHPTSYRLNNRDECMTWMMSTLDNDEIKEHPSHVHWILKAGEGIQNARGLTLLNGSDSLQLAQIYFDENVCELADDTLKYNVVAQRYVRNPLLVHGKKVDFRVYTYVASVDPLLVFFFPGFIRVAAAAYEDEPSDLAHYSNIAAAKKLDKYQYDAKFRHAHVLSFEQLQHYLYKEGLVQDQYYVRDVVKPQMKQHMVHILNSVDRDLEKWQGRFGIWGLDFMLDSNLKLWFLEVNTAPNLNTGGDNPRTTGLKSRLLKEVFEVQEYIVRYGVRGLDKFRFRSLEPVMYRKYKETPISNDKELHQSAIRGRQRRRPPGDPLAKYLDRTYKATHASEYFGNIPRICIRRVNSVMTRYLNTQVPLLPQKRLTSSDNVYIPGNAARKKTIKRSS